MKRKIKLENNGIIEISKKERGKKTYEREVHDTRNMKRKNNEKNKNILLGRQAAPLKK